MYENDNCTDMVDSVPPDGQCTNTVNSDGSFMLDAGTWMADTCASTVVQEGEVSFGPSEKLCCLPTP